MSVTAKVYKTKGASPSFREGSARMQLWNMIKNGMTVGKLLEAATEAGLDGRAVIRKINVVAPGALTFREGESK